MKAICLLLAVPVLSVLLAGCVNVNAPEKVEIKADSGNDKWNRVADKYVSDYAGGKSDKTDKTKKD